MITREDLQAAIAECQGVRNPNASTCIKLAAFYTLQDHLFGNAETLTKEPAYSFAANDSGINYQSGSEFSQAIQSKRSSDVWPIIDELMETLSVVNPRLYASVMRKIE